MAEETDKYYFNRNKCKSIDKDGGNSVDGKTVVATQDLKRWEVVCYICGEIYSNPKDKHKEAVGRMRDKKIKGLYAYKYRGSNKISIEPIDHISRLINHSCKPSCYIKWNRKEKMMTICAKRALKKGDEITINYSRGWFKCHNIGCQCGSEGCWGYIYQNDNEQSESPKAKSAPSILISEEGKRFEKKCKGYERSSKLRKAVIERDGYICQVCGKSLEETYGSFAKKLIQVHHGVPVSSNNGESFESSIDDMIAICPNCHWVLHHRFPEKPGKEAIEKLQNKILAMRTRKKRK